MRKKKTTRSVASFDYQLVILLAILSLLGVLFVADASAPLAFRSFDDKFFFVKQQAVWLLIGYAIMFILSKLRYEFWQKVSPLLFLFSLVLLVMVFIPGIGKNILGAKRWIYLGGQSFQPSEFTKFALVLYFSNLIAKDKKLVALIVPLVIVLGLIMLQPDLGTALIIFSIGISLITFSGINFFKLILLGGVSFVSVFLLIITSSYRKARLMTFLSQTTDPLGSSYHVRQILIALGSGGLFGVGLGQSRQKHLFLPETATDSIFAIVAEEIGFIGSAVIILVFLLLILRIIRIASKVDDKFPKSVAVGIATWIGVQTFLNIASMVALVPLTGIPLPFFSYGGTSLVMLFVACGILLNISRYANK